MAIGGDIVAVSDEFFAEAFNLLLVEVRAQILLLSHPALMPHLIACSELERTIWAKRSAVQRMGDQTTQPRS